MLQYEEGQSPLDSLEQVAIHYASAIKLKPKDPRFHFLLGQALEEQHHATEMYGLKKKVIYRYTVICLGLWCGVDHHHSFIRCYSIAV